MCPYLLLVSWLAYAKASSAWKKFSSFRDLHDNIAADKNELIVGGGPSRNMDQKGKRCRRNEIWRYWCIQME